MCVDYVLVSLRIAQVDPSDGPPSEVVLSHTIIKDSAHSLVEPIDGIAIRSR
jgi:hypothetical protein